MRGFRKHVDENFENPLLKREDWYTAALDAFSQQYFDDVSLNAVLSAAGMSKSSFYFKFYDKLDIYLCMMERGAAEKVTFLSEQMKAIEMSQDFFERLHVIALGSMQFAKHDPRFYIFWRTYLGDSEHIKKKMHETFPDAGSDMLGPMIDEAIDSNQISQRYDRQFVYDAVNLYFTNMDSFVDASMSDDEVMAKVDQVIHFLKSSLSA